MEDRVPAAGPSTTGLDFCPEFSDDGRDVRNDAPDAAHAEDVVPGRLLDMATWQGDVNRVNVFGLKAN